MKEVAVQNTLPLFEGEQPEREVVKISGEMVQPWGADPLHRRAEYFAIVRFRIGEVNHKDDPDGFLERRAAAKMTSAVLVDSMAGKALQQQWRDEHVRRIHEAAAQRTFSDLQAGLFPDGVDTIQFSDDEGNEIGTLERPEEES